MLLELILQFIYSLDLENCGVRHVFQAMRQSGCVPVILIQICLDFPGHFIICISSETSDIYFQLFSMDSRIKSSNIGIQKVSPLYDLAPVRFFTHFKSKMQVFVYFRAKKEKKIRPSYLLFHSFDFLFCGPKLNSVFISLMIQAFRAQWKIKALLLHNTFGILHNYV